VLAYNGFTRQSTVDIGVVGHFAVELTVGASPTTPPTRSIANAA
jgi:hypothetical protein